MRREIEPVKSRVIPGENTSVNNTYDGDWYAAIMNPNESLFQIWETGE
jgi:hypothetical protein